MRDKIRYAGAASLFFSMCFFFFLSLALSGCGRGEKKKGEDTTGAGQIQDPEEGTTAGAVAGTEEIDDVTLDGMSRDILGGMTLDEKIGQMLFVGLDTLRGDGKSGKLTRCDSAIEEKMEAWHPGGVILYSRNMEDPKQLKALTGALQQASRIPLFLGTEEEGGSFCRIASQKKMGVAATEDARDLGSLGDESNVEKTGAEIASYMKELGLNLNFAPLADVGEAASEERLEKRSFSEDTETTALMAAAFVRGSQKEGVSAVLKYFPGQGALGEDTHKGSADLDKTIKELREKEFKPFTEGIKSGVDLVMVGHASYSEVTQDLTPASLSKLMVTDILRQELRFDSVIITDSMNMKAITEVYSVDDAAAMAVEAGADMILCPDNGREAYEGILQAVNSGKIGEERIDESVLRILKAKIRRGVVPMDTDLVDKGKITD